MITLWHNPRCSKSRAALALLEQAGADITLRLYLQDAPSEPELRAAHSLLNRPVIDMLRMGEPAFKTQGLTKNSPDDALFKAMATHPKLIERPLALTAKQAVIGRPPEDVLGLL